MANRVVRHKHLTGGIVFVEGIPKNASGKILRRYLRDRAGVRDNKDKVWFTTRTKTKL